MKRFIVITVAIFCILALIGGCSGGGNQNAATTQLQGGQQQQGQQGGQKSQGQQGGQQGGQQSQGEGEKMIEPQQLISRQEAAQLVGEPVKDPIKEEQQMLGLKLCLYVAEKPDSKSYLLVAVVQQGAMQGGGGGQSGGEGGGESGGGQGGQGGKSGGGGGESGSGGSGGGQSGGQGGGGGQEEMTPKSLFEALKKTLADPNADAGRIGEEAFISAPGISILSGEYYVYVAASGVDPAKTHQIIKQAGELAVNNLKRMLGQ